MVLHWVWKVRKCVRIRVRVDAGEVKAVCMHA